MILRFRPARQEDVPAVVALLRDDVLGARRESGTPEDYARAFAGMQSEAANHLIVGETPAGEIVATYQVTFISGLSLRATRRAQVEGVRVAGHLRGQGLGHQLLADVEARAREAGCGLIQLTSNAGRADARRFYEALGFTPSHIGYKRDLS